MSDALSGAGGASDKVGRLRAAGVFGEARVPLIQDLTAMKDLTLDTGRRYSDYASGIQAKTYKIGFQYSPMDDICIRGSCQKAIRARMNQQGFAQDDARECSACPRRPGPLAQARTPCKLTSRESGRGSQNTGGAPSAGK